MKILDLFTNYKTVKYDSKTTILRCDKCCHEEVEWYNDQPGDPCSNYVPTCSGKMYRVYKKISYV